MHRWLISTVLGLGLVTQGAALAAEPVIEVAVVDEHESFVLWYAQKRGWDREAGINLSLNLYHYGQDILRHYGDGEWDVAAIGALPVVMGNHEVRIPVIGYANEEARANMVIVNKGSDIARVRGFNKQYPAVLGSPETVKGRTFFFKAGSGAEYVLTCWLEALGLTSKDVKMVAMYQDQTMSAFRRKKGDGMALWAPLAVEALLEGGVKAADLADLGGLSLPLCFAANEAYAKEHPDEVARFLLVYFRAARDLSARPSAELVDEYLEFYDKFCHVKQKRNVALEDLKIRELPTLDEELALFDAGAGSSRMQQVMGGFAQFFVANGSLSAAEGQRLGSAAYVTDTYLKRARELAGEVAQ
mgnify:CR=1 FL=1